MKKARPPREEEGWPRRSQRPGRRTAARLCRTCLQAARMSLERTGAPEFATRLPREEVGQPRLSIVPAREEEGRLSRWDPAREEEGGDPVTIGPGRRRGLSSLHRTAPAGTVRNSISSPARAVGGLVRKPGNHAAADAEVFKIAAWQRIQFSIGAAVDPATRKPVAQRGKRRGLHSVARGGLSEVSHCRQPSMSALRSRDQQRRVETKMALMLRLHNSQFVNAAMQQEHGKNAVITGS